MADVAGEMRQRLRWADGKLVKDAIDQQLEALLGPRGQQTNNNTPQVYSYTYCSLTHSSNPKSCSSQKCA